jgi:hypothetical protein
MQRTLILGLLASSSLLAQPETNHVFITGGMAVSGAQKISATPVQGAPYSANITNESVQTLADGNRIVQTSTGTTARDSMGRTRQDAPLPAIANMAPAGAPHLVFIQDPVAQTSYTLNLTDKAATKGPGFAMAMPATRLATSDVGMSTETIRAVAVPGLQGALGTPQPMAIQSFAVADSGQAQTEDLGSKTMEGVMVTGTRTTHTIAAGQIGNDKPISIVTEVWTSPELKTVVYSKRSDPRMGDQTFQLTNIVRAEPDPSLFIVPSDFKISEAHLKLDAPGPIVYKMSGGSGQ